MGEREHKTKSKSKSKSQTLPPSPARSFSSSSSSDFEFTVSISPRKSSAALCPADELFYKGQLLPLHLSPRISMVRTLLLASSSSSSSDHSRDSTGSSNDSFTALLAECDSSRPSSVAADAEDDTDFKLKPLANKKSANKYFSLSKFSSVFRKENANSDGKNRGDSVKRVSATAKEVFRKYLKKVKPLYDKLSKQQQQKTGRAAAPETTKSPAADRSVRNKDSLCQSFSGNLRYPRRSCVSSCPSSMRSSPTHSGVLSRAADLGRSGSGGFYGETTSSMEELQSAIQGAIAHCKNSMIGHKTGPVSNQ